LKPEFLSASVCSGSILRESAILADIRRPRNRPNCLTIRDFLQRVLIDPPAHEFPLRNLRDPCQLFIIRNSIPSSLVLNSLEIQQTQIFAFFRMPIGFLANVDWWPVRDDVRTLQRSSRVELARLSGVNHFFRSGVLIVADQLTPVTAQLTAVAA
jgi:hypothetical protein